MGGELKGMGVRMEGREKNGVMLELMWEVGWGGEKLSKEEWLKEYVFGG